MTKIPSASIPLLFVFLWSSAYIAFQYCSAYIEPATFILVRTAITAAILFFIALLMKKRWPKRWRDFVHPVIVGVLLHGVYTGGTFASVYNGLDVALCALIIGLQPILTVVLSNIFLGEKITYRKMFGILIGFLGVLVVMLDSISFTALDAMQTVSMPRARNGLFSIFASFLALLAISSATIVQKRYCRDIELIPGACIQFTAAGVFVLPIALVFESMEIDWNMNFIFSMGWLVVFVSIGAMLLLMTLIKNDEAGSVANLFYLVAPLVAIEAWIIFDQEISLTSIGGMIFCLVGVIIVNSVSTVKLCRAIAHSGGTYQNSIVNVSGGLTHARISKTLCCHVAKLERIRRKKKIPLPEFKATVALTALRGDMTTDAMVRKYNVMPAQIAEWRKQLVNSASSVFDEGTRMSIDHEQQVAELHTKIGQLVMKNDSLERERDGIRRPESNTAAKGKARHQFPLKSGV